MTNRDRAEILALPQPEATVEDEQQTASISLGSKGEKRTGKQAHQLKTRNFCPCFRRVSVVIQNFIAESESRDTCAELGSWKAVDLISAFEARHQ